MPCIQSKLNLMVVVLLTTSPLILAENITPLGADEHWVSGFGIQGLNNTVRALATSGGELYVGGLFTAAADVAANRIAKRNGAAWSTLGSGFDGSVRALLANGSELYAGGFFDHAGDMPAKRIAKWDGSAWSALGSGMDGEVKALALLGTELYAAGDFTHVGAVEANNIARWNGTSWSPLAEGLNGMVNALVVHGGELYAAGEFTRAGSQDALRIARWNGSTWSALGDGLNGAVHALASSGTALYVGGSFNSAGVVAANRIARWDGAAWAPLGSGLSNICYALSISGTELYAAGAFINAGSQPASRIAKWDGLNWSALGGGLNSTGYALACIGEQLYVGGLFVNAEARSANHIAQWNGTAWNALGSQTGLGFNGEVYALALGGDALYAGGSFTAAGGTDASRIASWNGTAWSALGSGMSNGVYALALVNGQLYAGGTFMTAGGIDAKRIAKWEGGSWAPLGEGLNAGVNALCVVGGELYVGGEFDQAGGQPANHIAKWNGSAWSALGNGVNGTVHALATDGTNLYVGGAFTQANLAEAKYIARWDGSSWSALGAGLNARVDALCVSDGHLFAGGAFTRAGTLTVDYIARWDGSAWSALNSGLSGSVKALATRGGELFAGGAFTYADGQPAHAIAKWAGSSWSTLGSGLNSEVAALAASETALFAGGLFAVAGGKVSVHFAVFANTAPLNTVAPQVSAASVAQTITTTSGSWSDAEGDTLTVSYQWQRADDAAGLNALDIPGANAGSYGLAISEAHKFLRVKVVAADGYGAFSSVVTPWSLVENLAPANSVAPAVSGIHRIDQILSASDGSWSDAENDPFVYSYQWLRADDAVGSGVTPIVGAVAPSYSLVAAEVLKFVCVRVRACDDWGGVGEAQSAYVQVQKKPQIIEFPSMPQKTYGDADFEPCATISSGLPFSYTSSNLAVAVLVRGAIHIIGAGQTTISAWQAGDAVHAAAEETQLLTVAKASAEVSLANLTQTYNGTQRVVAVSTQPAGLNVVLTYNASSTAPTSAGTYRVVGTISDVNYQGTASGTLVVNAPPALTSGLTAAPNPVIVGQPVALLLVADDSDGDTLSYSWSFGDGTTANEPTPTHRYVAPGVYVAVVTISDGRGGQTHSSVTLQVSAGGGALPGDTDSDGDGFSDQVETTLGSSPTEAGDAPFGLPAPAAPAPLLVGALAIKLNFSKPASDSIGLSGYLALPAGLAVAEQRVIVDVGGVVKALALDARGAAPKSTSDSFKLTVKLSKGGMPAQSAKFSAKFQKGDFAAVLADDGLRNASLAGASVNLPVTLIFNGQVLQTSVLRVYSAKAGKSGATRSQ